MAKPLEHKVCQILQTGKALCIISLTLPAMTCNSPRWIAWGDPRDALVIALRDHQVLSVDDSISMGL
jgi:hypothetical protein